MWPIRIVFVLTILTQLSLTREAYAQQESVRDSVFIKEFAIDTLITMPKLGSDFSSKRNFNLPDIPEIDRKFLPGNERIFRQIPGMQEFDNQQPGSEFPGSSRFYARRPYLHINPGSRNFIMKPDSSVKYYLIIKDPLRHTVTK